MKKNLGHTWDACKIQKNGWRPETVMKMIRGRGGNKLELKEIKNEYSKTVFIGVLQPLNKTQINDSMCSRK